MAHAIWKGSIRFGLVQIPVGLHSAESRHELDFSLLDRRDLSPIGYRKVNKSTGKEVPSQQIVRGFEIKDGRYVLVTDEDLRRASVERTQTIDILTFVEGSEIDPSYYDRPYYLAPVSKSEKSYTLLRQTLLRTGKVGIATVVIHTRQHLAALIARSDVLLLDLLRYPNELSDPKRLELPSRTEKISDKEIKMAERLVTEMAEPWDPKQYKDEYREELLAFIRKKAAKGQAKEAKEAEEEPEPRKKKAEVLDLMSLLKQSVDQRGATGRSRKVARKPKTRTAKTAPRKKTA